VRAYSGGDVEPVAYAEIPEEMIFRWVPPQDLMFVRLIVEVAWSGENWNIVPTNDAGVYEGRMSVADFPLLTELRYHWQGRDATTGQPVRTTWESVERPDPNSRAAEWQCYSGMHVDVCVHWNIRGLEGPWMDAGDAGYESAEAILGDAVREHGSRPRVIIFANQTFYRMVSPVVESSGIAFPEYGVTLQYVAGNSELASDTIPHEIMHLLDPTSKRLDVPSWFTEGLAVANEMAEHDDEIQLVRDARREGLLYSWETMRWRCDSAWCDSALWYAQAYHMIDALGLGNAQAVIAEMDNTRSFSAAWSQIVGESPSDWGARYTRRQIRRWDVIGTVSGFTLVACGYVIYRRRR
jgi:hypothetical protein